MICDFVILGDTHFGVRNDSQVFHEHNRKFYTEVLFPYMKENNIFRIIQLGDLFDRRKYINFLSLSMAKEYFFDPMRDMGIEMFALVGNHDVFYKNTLRINSLKLLLESYDNIKIIEEPCTTLGIDFIPWICEENEQRIKEFIEKSKSKLCVGHFELSGFEMDRGNICHEGWSASNLSKYDLVYSGHFHHRSHKGNILYVGSPTEMTWADHDDVRGFQLLRYDSDGVTKRPNVDDFVVNPNKIFVKLYYNDDNMYYDDVVNIDFGHLKNKYVKVVVDKKNNTFLFETYLDQISKVDPADLSVVENFTEESQCDDEEVDQSEDTISIIDRVIDNMDRIEVNKQKLKSVFRSVHNEALSIGNGTQE